jgi:hypothetical protein
MTVHRPRLYSCNHSRHMRKQLIDNVGNVRYDDAANARFDIRAPTVVALGTTSTVTNNEFNQTC